MKKQCVFTVGVDPDVDPLGFLAYAILMLPHGRYHEFEDGHFSYQIGEIFEFEGKDYCIYKVEHITPHVGKYKGCNVLVKCLWLNLSKKI